MLVEVLPGTPCIERDASLRRSHVLFADWVSQHPNNGCAYASFQVAGIFPSFVWPLSDLEKELVLSVADHREYSIMPFGLLCLVHSVH